MAEKKATTKRAVCKTATAKKAAAPKKATEILVDAENAGFRGYCSVCLRALQSNR